MKQEIRKHTADPKFINKDGYFPLEAEVNELMWSALPRTHKNQIPMMEILFGMDKIKVDDSLFGYGFGTNYRTQSFLNVKRSRPIIESKKSHKDYSDTYACFYLGMARTATSY